MLNIGAPEILVVIVVALVVLGPDRLPGAARQAGRFVQDVKKWTSGLEHEIRTAASAPSDPPSSAPPASSAVLADADDRS